MTAVLWLPVLVALLAGAVTGVVHRRLPPNLAARILTFTAVGAALAVTWGLAIAAFAFAIQVPWIAERAGWCRVLLASHHRVPPPAGIISGLAIVIGAYRAIRWQRHCRNVARVVGAGTGPIEVVPLEEPAAFAVPGRPGHIVVSQAMLDCLDVQQQRALLAHEQAHLDHHHHRYVRLADLAAEAVPVLHPIRAHVRFCTERWADEVAAEKVGDRRVVASAIARAALASAGSSTAPTLDFAGNGIAARVQALIDPREHAALGSIVATASLFASLAFVVAGSTVQLHHLLAFAVHVCQI